MLTAPKPHSALLIVGHGSTENPDSSAPYFEHADEIRRRALFAEVHCCFWKEEPSLREAFYLIDSDEVYVVPDFISEGYFTQEVIPRELQLTGPTTVVHGKTFHYCLPVGIHPSMTGLILRRAKEVAPTVDPAQTTLIITGHGTALNPNSTKAIRDQVDLIAASTAGYAAVLAAYMEEPPFIADWHQMATTPHVIVVPFFIADGLHSYQDIPVLLGIEHETGTAASQREVFRHNPHLVHGKTLYYSSAIGTERLLADVILDQIADFDQLHPPAPASPQARPSTLAQTFHQWLQSGVQRMGELVFQSGVCNGCFMLCHWQDVGLLEQPAAGGLEIHHGPGAARDLATYTAAGDYRFAKGQTNLKRGWVMMLANEEELRQALDQFYPAGLGLSAALENGTLEIEHLRAKLERQTGMYRFARTISDAGAQRLVREVCGPAHQCAKRILWQIDPNTRLDDSEASRFNGIPNHLTQAAAIPLLCREACNHFVSECRRVAKEEAAAKAPTE